MANIANSPQEVVIFIHLPKTAGTTLYDILKKQYSKRNILTFHGVIGQNREAFEKQYQYTLNKNQVSLIKGHMNYGLHDVLDCPYKYITVLRNPINRIISVYYYLVQSKFHPQHHLVKGKTLEEFVTSDMAHHNGQTRFIAGEYNPSDKLQPANLLERAKKNLQEDFAVVGLTERFDESLMLLQRKLGWKKMPFYVKENKSKKPHDSSISGQAYDLIIEKNSLDIHLYQYAQEIFDLVYYNLLFIDY